MDGSGLTFTADQLATDSDGDLLIVQSAIPGTSGIVDLNVTGGQLLINPVVAGETLVTVTVTDSKGAGVEVTYLVHLSRWDGLLKEHFRNEELLKDGYTIMLIQCTKKLLDQLDIKPNAPADEDPLFSWHANLITVNRRKAVVLVNDKNRYVVVLHGLKAKDFNKLDVHIVQAIRETFQDECIKNEIIDRFINHSKEIIFTKTKDRKSVARLNKACETLFYYEELLEGISIYKSAMSIKVSRYLVGDGKNKYIRPNKELYKDLEAFAGKPILGCKAVELKVTLDLDKHNVWRRIVVPVNTTFNKLHEVLQAAFGWKDYHLHEFYIYGNEQFANESLINHPGYHKEGFRSIINLVCDVETFEYEDDVPMKLETGIRLSEYIPEYKRMKYNYDFGDNWQHYIEVQRVLDDYDENHPVCLAGEGNTPPEDVGGKYGYEEFVEIIADEKHPEHEDMVIWGEGQGYMDFDIEMVNRMFKHL